MSPVGGIGINVAIHGAVAAGNILARGLRAGPVPEALLAEVQKRREWPMRMTQGLQVVVQNLVIRNVLQMQKQPRAPFLVKLLNWIPALRRIPGRIVGMGFTPEHVRTPKAA
jgi:2-polyprenyl-6-methoxyphenol hydroxylase-like FAD-dependent oxidoreductase